jgi:hypothetical protein
VTECLQRRFDVGLDRFCGECSGRPVPGVGAQQPLDRGPVVGGGGAQEPSGVGLSGDAFQCVDAPESDGGVLVGELFDRLSDASGEGFIF